MEFINEKKEFKNIDINDTFFDSLKADYDNGSGEFSSWFKRKAQQGEEAYVQYNQEGKLTAFLYLKEEYEDLGISGYGQKRRLKIGTFKLSDEIQGQKVGEAYVATALTTAYYELFDEVYVTAFERQKKLIEIFKSFGFQKVGSKGLESVYLRVMKNEGTPRECYPYINIDNSRGKYLLLEANYHDKLFPTAQLKNIDQTVNHVIAGKGISKCYISFGFQVAEQYKNGDVLLMYRKGITNKNYTSAVTSLGVCEEVIPVVSNGRKLMTLEEYKKRVGNKSVFDNEELNKFYNKNNVTIIKFIYNIPFGEGKNINCDQLKNMQLFGKNGNYPMNDILTKNEVIDIIKFGNSGIENIIL